MSAGALTDAARAARRLGILGGSFDPPHLGHLHAAREARRAFELDHVVFVPAARPPHKPDRMLAEGEDRLAMVDLLIQHESWSSSSRVELDREGPSFSIDTVRAFRKEVDEAAMLFWILGSDNLAGLPGWREAETLLTLTRPIVIAREHEDLETELQRALESTAAARLSPALVERLRSGLCVVPPVEASSSELRRRIAAGELAGETLPGAVAEYIAARGIYRAA